MAQERVKEKRIRVTKQELADSNEKLNEVLRDLQGEVERLRISRAAASAKIDVFRMRLAAAELSRDHWKLKAEQLLTQLETRGAVDPRTVRGALFVFPHTDTELASLTATKA